VSKDRERECYFRKKGRWQENYELSNSMERWLGVIGGKTVEHDLLRKQRKAASHAGYSAWRALDGLYMIEA